MRLIRVLFALVCMGPAVCGVRNARASVLLTLNVSGPGNFLIANQITGATTPVNPGVSLGPESWRGLAVVPGDPFAAFALQNPLPPRFEDPQTSRLARIDTRTGTATLFPLFDVDVLGSPEPFSRALAISPLEPDVATVIAFERNAPGDVLLFRVGLDSGEVLGPALILPERRAIFALAFGPNGEMLYGSDGDGLLVTIDPATGVISDVGDPNLSTQLTGLAFRPEDGALFAIDAALNDRLVRLDPATGETLSTVGPMNIPGPTGLAFVEPPVPDIEGDVNLDGRVDLQDLNEVRNHFLEVGVGIPGDSNGSGTVDLIDLNAVRNNFGTTNSGAPTPEPAAWLMLAIGLGSLALRKGATYRRS